MSLSRLKKVAIIDGNLTVAKLLDYLQPCSEANKHHIAYTDGKLVYVGEGFWKMPLKEQYFVINHEFLHIVYKHIERGRNKNAEIYNIAADIIINDVLLKRGRAAPDLAVTYTTYGVPEHLDTTELIYNYLMQNGAQHDFEEHDLIECVAGDTEAIRKVHELAESESKSTLRAQLMKEGIEHIPQNLITKVDWFNGLMCEIGRLAVRSNIRTYTRPSRIKIEGCILHGGYIYQNIPKINIIIDVSGSMGENPLRIAAKINAMQAYLKVFKPVYYWLNTSYGKIDDITKIPLGGGTDLSLVAAIDGADLNVLITDCEDDSGVDAINKSVNRFYIVTNNPNCGIRESHKCRVHVTKIF